MQTRTPVQLAAQRRAFRKEAERRGQRAAVRLIAVTSLLRTGAGYLLPGAGSAGWWLTMACAAPAVLVCLMGYMAVRRTGSETLHQAAERLLGVRFARLLGWAEAACLAVEGAACLTALVTLLDDGVGIAVSPAVLAAATSAVLALCIPGEGLARSVQLLRWAMIPLLALILAELLGMAKADHLFPVLGDGAAQSMQRTLPYLGAGWPLVLLLEIPKPEGGRRIREWYGPLLAPLLLLTVTLAIPHEILARRTGLAAGLLLPGAFVSPANRTLLMCLWMLLAALCTAICAKGAAGRRVPGAWLLLAGFAALQLPGAARAAALLRQAQLWIPAVLAVMALLTSGASFIRRRKL